MSTPRRFQAHRASDHLGLMANGSSGEWEVAVDETTAGPNRWFIQIEGPNAYCSFEVPSPRTVYEAYKFLAGRGADSPLVIGKHPKSPATLIRDDEYTDRYFLVIGPDTARTRLTVAGKDLEDLTEALRQAVEDIEDES